MTEKRVHLYLSISLFTMVMLIYIAAYIMKFKDINHVLYGACPLIFFLAVLFGILMSKLEFKKTYTKKILLNRFIIYSTLFFISVFMIIKNNNLGYFGALPVYLTGSAGLQFIYFYIT